MTNEAFRPTELRSREEELARLIAPGANSVEASLFALDFPEKVDGLRIVDVGSGFSLLTHYLNDEGAEAYGVDPIYENRQRFRTGTKLFMQRMTRGIPQGSQKTAEQTLQESVAFFRGVFSENREMYKSGHATDLPFEDEFADIVTSLFAVSYLAEDMKVLEAAASEMLRITKRGGMIEIAPFHVRGSAYCEYLSEHDELARFFASRDDVNDVHVRRLRDTKRTATLFVQKTE